MTDLINEEVQELNQKIASVYLPPTLKIRADRMVIEITKSKDLPNNFENYERMKHYLDWIIKIPWATIANNQLDINQAKIILDQHHHGLEDVKTRILEYLAVIKLGQNQSQLVTLRSPILLLVGQAGTGKTTFAAALAEATHRPMIRIPFGGLGSAKDLRGQSRLHLEAEPGQIIKGIIKAGVINPVILLDEIDRISTDSRADVMGVLIELLDPEQNSAFLDYYLDFPIDLSQVLFIATCNNVSNIATAVMDRLEPIMMPSYTDQEKLIIAKEYLLPKAVNEANLSKDSILVDETVWPQIIRPLGYDSGIRTLKRTIQGITRKVALIMLKESTNTIRITTDNVKSFLPTYRTELL